MKQQWPLPAAVVDNPDDDNDDERNLHNCPHLSANLAEILPTLQPSTTINYHTKLAAITAECKQMQQRWPLPVAAVDIPDDKNKRNLHNCPHLSANSAEILPSLRPSTAFNYRETLAAITAKCKRMQQQWPLPAAVIDLLDDNNERHLKICPHLSASLAESLPSPRPSTAFNYQETLAAITANCE